MFTTRALEDASGALVEVLPGNLDKVYWLHGGTEATETAIKLAATSTIGLEGMNRNTAWSGSAPSYHGNTLGGAGRFRTGTASQTL